ncbi:MAG: XdhC family protein, partial [Anaerolineales bacterium]
MTDDSIFTRIAELAAKGESAALATVIRARGSVPRHPGSKMLVYPDGRIVGTVGGGEMESRVIEEARAALHDGGMRILRYELND